MPNLHRYAPSNEKSGFYIYALHNGQNVTYQVTRIAQQIFKQLGFDDGDSISGEILYTLHRFKLIYTNNSGVTPPDSLDEIQQLSEENASPTERKQFFKQLLQNGDLSKDNQGQLIDYLHEQDIVSEESNEQASNQTGSDKWRPDTPQTTTIYQGTVDFFNDTGGYGFISCSQVSEDVFYHMEEIGGRDIQENTDVAFVFETVEEGPRATNVRVIADRREGNPSEIGPKEAMYSSDELEARPPLNKFRKAKSYDEDIDVTFLGTAGGQPTKDRTTTSLLLQRGTERFLFDVGEGTQQQLVTHSSSVSIDAVFLTSVAVDHIGGLGPLLRRYSTDNRTKQLQIFTPSGTAEKIETLIDAFGELQYPIVVREVTDEEIVDAETYQITAFETALNEESVGYKLQEVPHRGTFDRERAGTLGVPEGPSFNKLCSGESVVLEDGTEVDPRQVVGDPIAGRNIVYTGDTQPTDAVVAAAEDADLLIHEAAALGEINNVSDERNHSTATDAGRIASRANANKLVLTNFSPGFGSQTQELQQEARNEYDGVVGIANDGMQIEVSAPLASISQNQHETTISDNKIEFSELKEGTYIQVMIDRVKKSGVGLSKAGRVHVDDAADYVGGNVTVLITSKETGYVKSEVKKPPSDTTVYPLQLDSEKARQTNSKGSSKSRKSASNTRSTSDWNPFSKNRSKNDLISGNKL